ncbi:hypothetical protein Pint_19582 [Pistacia integerrima]|uniref:Uncharacterized protein n=1 Tax=Pistacia integerrima TaxID=434235 RepID=A0ACC0XDZ2_9ROSI|nr:hypothetical protein Pint_19582 [Pistacia integerrima]
MDPNTHDLSTGASAIAYSEVISGSDERSGAASKFPGGSSGSANTTFCLDLGYDSKGNTVLVPDEICPVPGQVHGCNQSEAYPHAASVHMPAEFPDGCVDRNNAVQKFVAGSSDQSQVRISLGQLFLLHPGELEVACTYPEIIIEYLSIRDKKCSKSSCGEPICRCEICEIKRKYEVQLGKLKINDQYDKGARFLVTTDKRDYNMTNLSARRISSYFPEADQVQIAAEGLQVPSIWDLPRKAHLLKPQHKDILKELKAEAAVHPQAAFVHMPPELRDDYSNRDNAVSPKLSSSHEVVINITPSHHASSNPDSTEGAFFQFESIQAENAAFHEKTWGFFQPGNEQTEPLFNRGRMTEIILVVASQVSLTLLTQGSSSGSTLSPGAKILKQFVTICNVVGFLCCFCGILVCGRKPGRIARITTGCGYIATAYGFLAMMAMTLSDELMLWFAGVICIALLPVLAFAFMKFSVGVSQVSLARPSLKVVTTPSISHTNPVSSGGISSTM